MRIISSFKDYYDFADYNTPENDYKEMVYLRRTELKTTDAVLEPASEIRYYGYGCDESKIMSRWWEENKKTFSLPSLLKSVRAGCIFVCGKAYPFLFLRETAQIGAEGKNGQIRFSNCFNEAIKNSIAKEKQKPHWRQDKCDEEEFNFFKTYFTAKEFFDDVTFELRARYLRMDNNRRRRELNNFFDFYEGKDFSELYLRLDCPILLTLFEQKGRNCGCLKTEYEFMLNPNLYELDFMRVMAGEIMRQELDVFLSNALVKDVMPQIVLSDSEKIASHGFDPKTSFRNTKK